MAAPTVTLPRPLAAGASMALLAASLAAGSAHAQETPPPAYQLAAQRAGM